MLGIGESASAVRAVADGVVNDAVRGEACGEVMAHAAIAENTDNVGENASAILVPDRPARVWRGGQVTVLVAPGVPAVASRDPIPQAVPDRPAIAPVLPVPPSDSEKYRYIRHDSWILTACAIASFPLLVVSQ